MNYSEHRGNVGKVFGKLTIIGVYPNTPGYNYTYKCSCGVIGSAKSNKIIRGLQVSCGCYKREVLKNKLTKIHGMCRTPEYRSYSHAKERCNNPKVQNYHNYGGRGYKILI